MPYVPRPTTVVNCAHCGTHFTSRNLRRKYCSNSCNVLASYERTGRRAERASRTDLEKTVAEMRELLQLMQRENLKAKLVNLKTALQEPTQKRTKRS
jgi:hypothetical protein